jgi:hypothetical protein
VILSFFLTMSRPDGLLHNHLLLQVVLLHPSQILL